jgi:aromatic-L-amino-acid/L-tryptophan decarboxylase
MSDFTHAGLEPGPEETQELIEMTAQRVITYLSTLPTQPASDFAEAAEVARSLVEPLPATGQPYPELLALLFDRVIPKGCNTNSPGMFSYVNGGASIHGAIADLITSATNPYIGYWAAAPALVQLEHTVIRWLAELVGLGEGAGGVLLSGGSLANLGAIVTARKAMLDDDLRLATIYASDQIHHSVAKALMVAGFPDDALRVVPSDAAFRVRIDALVARIHEDRQAGRRPFFVVGSAGTTNTGAVDDLRELGALARRERLWFHVDAAYGGCFALTERGKAALAGIEQADTVTLDPHKSLFSPFGTGCLLARDPDALRRAHELHSDYIDGVIDTGEHASTANFADLSPELSRGMRGLRVWLPLKLLGANAFRAALDEKLDLARYAADQLAGMPGFELVARPELSILAFRATRAGLAANELDQLNREVLERVNERRKVHLSATNLAGRFTLRICVLSLRSHVQAVDTCLSELRDCHRS